MPDTDTITDKITHDTGTVLSMTYTKELFTTMHYLCSNYIPIYRALEWLRLLRKEFNL